MKLFALLLIAAAAGFFAGAYLPVQIPVEPPSDAATEDVAFFDFPEPEQVTTSADAPDYNFETIFSLPSIFDQLYYAYRLAAASTSSQLKLYVLLTQDWDDPFIKLNIAAIFIERLIQIDAPDAYQFVRISTELDQRYFVSHVYTSWARNDPQVALDHLSTLPNDPTKQYVIMRLLQDPVLQAGGLLAGFTQNLTAAQSSQLQISSLNRLPPEEAFERSLELDPSSGRNAMYVAARRWSASDPVAALQRISRLSNPQQRQALLQWTISRIGVQDIDQALDFAQQYDGTGRLTVSVLSALARNDPLRALPYVERYQDGSNSQQLLSALLGSWVTKDADAALAYLKTVPEVQQSRIMAQVAHFYARAKPEEALEWALTLDDKFRLARQQTFNVAVANNFELAERLITRIEDDDLKAGLIQSAVQGRLQYDPEGALDWITTFSGEEYYPQLHSQILQSMAHNYPLRVASLIENDIDDVAMSKVASSVALAWYQRDPAAAEAWVLGLPPSATRDTAISSLVYATSPADPDRALDLAAEILEDGDNRVKWSVAHHLARRMPDRLDEVVARMGMGADFVRQFNASNQRRMDEGY